MVSADKQQEKRRRKKNEISLKCLAAEEHNESCCNVDENEILKRRVSLHALPRVVYTKGPSLSPQSLQRQKKEEKARDENIRSRCVNVQQVIR